MTIGDQHIFFNSEILFLRNSVYSEETAKLNTEEPEFSSSRWQRSYLTHLSEQP